MTRGRDDLRIEQAVTGVQDLDLAHMGMQEVDVMMR
jgi:hypothetical protein